MKKYLFMLVVGIIFLAGFGPNEASAQSLRAIKVEVKFDFRVGHKLYPAGLYTLESFSRNSDNLLHLKGVDKKNRQVIIANLSYTAQAQSPKLIFRQLGNQYYLTEIFLADGKWGFSIPSPRRLSKEALASAKTVEVPVKN